VITFVVLAVVMVVGALGVVLLRQPVHAALSLVGTLLTLAVTYVTLHATFLAAVQVIVYAGAIMVLFLFVLMLLNVGDTTGPKRSLPGLRWAAYAAGVVLAAAVGVATFLQVRPAPDDAVAAQALASGAAGIADVLFGDFLLAFHLVGVLLLTGVVGAVALVQRRAETVHGAAPVARAAAPPLPAGERASLPGGRP